MLKQQEIINQLNELKAIEPEKGFVQRTRGLILAVPAIKPARIWGWPLVWAGVAAVLLLALTLTFANPLTAKPKLSVFFNQQDLKQEFNNLSVKIQLQEIAYRQNLDSAIGLALNEISDRQPDHLNPALLQKEQAGLETDGANKQKEINDLLNQVIF